MAMLSQLGILGWIDAIRHLIGRVTSRNELEISPSLSGALIPVLIMLPMSVYGLFGILVPAYDLPKRVDDPALLADQYTSPADVTWVDGQIRLIGFTIAPTAARPGDPVFVTLCWESGGPLDEAIPYAIHIVDPADNKYGARNTHPGLGMYATTFWQPGEAFCDRLLVPLRDDTPTLATYRVVLSYFHEETLEPVPATLGDGTVENTVTLGEMAVLPAKWEDGGSPVVRFGDDIGITDWERADTSTSVALTLRWLTFADISRDYTVFVHVLDSESGEVVAQSDMPPRQGSFPTRYWPAGAVIPDSISANIAGLEPGVYSVVFGLYDSETLGRLPVYDSQTDTLMGDSVHVGELEVEN
jgi:hypothetical protein